VRFMAKNISKKKPLFGNQRSHALNITKKAQKPNLQTTTIDGKKVKLTAREMKQSKKA